MTKSCIINCISTYLQVDKDVLAKPYFNNTLNIYCISKMYANIIFIFFIIFNFIFYFSLFFHFLTFDILYQICRVSKGLFSQSDGSASVKYGHTRFAVGVRAEIGR